MLNRSEDLELRILFRYQLKPSRIENFGMISNWTLYIGNGVL